MQPKRFSVLSILGNRGSPLSEETTIDRLPIRHHADDEVIIKYLFERLSETAYAFYHLAKPQEISIESQMEHTFSFEEIRSSQVSLPPEIFFFFPFGKEGRPISVSHLITENKNEKSNCKR